MTPASNPRPRPGQRPTLPAKWAPGEDRFIRPDVGPGDRPVGASFASRTAVYGMSGAAGTAHPLATMAGIDILKRGGSAVDAAIAINACLGFLEPTVQRHRRRLLCHALGPQGAQGHGTCGLGQVAARS